VTALLFQTLAAALGSMAFGIVYHVKRKHLWTVALGGGVGWLLYSVFLQITDSGFISNMVASMFATGYSEIMARKRKAPAVVFLLPCLIPLVPGGGLYYSMSYTVLKDFTQSYAYVFSTAEAAFGIAAGIIVVSVVVKFNVDKNKKESGRVSHVGN